MKINKRLVNFLFLNKIRTDIFLICVLLSVLFWVFVKLSKEYNSVIELNLKYKNIPYDIISYIDDNQELKIRLKVRTTGFNLLAYKFFDRSLHIDLQNVLKNDNTKKDKIIWNIDKEHLEYHSDLKSISVIDIHYPKYIEFDRIGNIKTKKVPIVLNGIIKPINGFTLKKPIFFHPDSVEVEGLESVIKKIKFINTENINFINIKDDIETNIDLENLNKFKLKDLSIHLEILVEPLIEKSIDLRINTKNKKLKVIPEYVNVLFNVGESKYNDLDTSFFEVTIDLENRNNENIVPVKLIPKNIGIDILKINPAVVRFMIEDK